MRFKRYLRLLLDVVVLLSSNIQNTYGSSTEEQDVVGEGGDLAGQFDSGNKNQSSGRGGLRRVGRKGLNNRIVSH